MNIDINAYIATFKNPRYVKNGGILFDTILDGEPQMFLAVAQDHHEYTAEVFNDAIAGKFGKIAPFVPNPSDARGHLNNTLNSISASLGNAITQIIGGYGPGYAHVAQIILSAGGRPLPASPLYKSVADFAEAHAQTVEQLSHLVTTLTTVGVGNGTALKTATTVVNNAKSTESQIDAAVKAFEVAINGLIGAVKAVAPSAQIIPVTVARDPPAS
jgi:hypothetical protein